MQNYSPHIRLKFVQEKSGEYSLITLNQPQLYTGAKAVNRLCIDIDELYIDDLVYCEFLNARDEKLTVPLSMVIDLENRQNRVAKLEIPSIVLSEPGTKKAVITVKRPFISNSTERMRLITTKQYSFNVEFSGASEEYESMPVTNVDNLQNQINELKKGTTIEYKGFWESGEIYYKNDLVSYWYYPNSDNKKVNGLYICIRNTQKNEFDSTDWRLICYSMQGENGEDGEDGISYNFVGKWTEDGSYTGEYTPGGGEGRSSSDIVEYETIIAGFEGVTERYTSLFRCCVTHVAKPHQGQIIKPGDMFDEYTPYWQEILRVPEGKKGKSVRYRGEYKQIPEGGLTPDDDPLDYAYYNDVDYLDIVTFKGSAYVPKVGMVAGQPPTNAEYWDVLVKSESGGKKEEILFEGELKEEDTYSECPYVDSYNSSEIRNTMMSNIPFNRKLKNGDKIRIYYTAITNDGRECEYVLNYEVYETMTMLISEALGTPIEDDFELSQSSLFLSGIMESSTSPYAPLSKNAYFYGVDRYSLGGELKTIYNGDKYIALIESMGETLSDAEKMAFKNGVNVMLTTFSGITPDTKVWWNYSGSEKRTQILHCCLNLQSQALGIIYRENEISSYDDFISPVVFKKVTLIES